MLRRFFSNLTATVFLLLIPYFVTIFINGPDTALLNRTFDLEDCIPAAVNLEISGEMEMEAWKCQAVIARTNLYRRLDEGEKMGEILRQIYRSLLENGEIFSFISRDWEKASEETRGLILTADGQLKLVPFHELSGGKTRDGAEVFHSEEYAYLKSVDSSIDKNSPDYLSSTYISKQQIPKNFEISQRDSAGYVVCLKTDNNLLEGEGFRLGMGLASADFTFLDMGEEYRFLCRGKGHGLGFSQYGGNELAKQGKTYEEILEIYFPEMQLGKITNM